MQLDAGVRRPGKASAAKNAYTHAEVSPVFLRVNVAGCFRSSEQGMQRAIDAAILVDSVEIGWIRVVVARFGFAQRLFVGRVTVDLIGAHEDESGVAAMLARGLQKIHRAERIDFEIKQCDVSCLVMRRLRRAVNNQVETMLAKQSHDAFAIANIERCRREPFRGSLQSLKIPQRISRRSEENPAHVIVRADDEMALPVKIFDRFRANQAAASGHKDVPGLHFAAPPTSEPSRTRPLPSAR